MTRDEAIRKLVKMIAVVGLGVAVWGTILWIVHSHPSPECDGKPMHRLDTCVNKIDGTSKTYDEQMRSLKDSVPIDKILVGIGASVFAVSGTTSLALWRRKAR